MKITKEYTENTGRISVSYKMSHNGKSVLKTVYNIIKQNKYDTDDLIHLEVTYSEKNNKDILTVSAEYIFFDYQMYRVFALIDQIAEHIITKNFVESL